MSSTEDSVSLRLARAFLGRTVDVVVDRPIGSVHPTGAFTYLLNYGYIPGTTAPDGEELDAYLIGPSGPVDGATGVCVAVVHRLQDDDDKLVVTTGGETPSDAEIRRLVDFQEGGHPYRIVRASLSATHVEERNDR